MLLLLLLSMLLLLMGLPMNKLEISVRVSPCVSGRYRKTRMTASDATKLFIQKMPERPTTWYKLGNNLREIKTPMYLKISKKIPFHRYEG